MANFTTSSNVQTLLFSSTFVDFRTSLDVYSKPEVDALIPSVTGFLNNTTDTFTGVLSVDGTLKVNAVNPFTAGGNININSVVVHNGYVEALSVNVSNIIFTSNTSAGLLLNQLSSAEISALFAASGSVVYNTTKGVPFYNGPIWMSIGSQVVNVVVDRIIDEFDENATLFCDATAGDIEITLPIAVTVPGFRLTIKKIDSGANKITITEQLDGALRELIVQYESIKIQSDGFNYYIL